MKLSNKYLNKVLNEWMKYYKILSILNIILYIIIIMYNISLLIIVMYIIYLYFACILGYNQKNIIFIFYI